MIENEKWKEVGDALIVTKIALSMRPRSTLVLAQSSPYADQ